MVEDGARGHHEAFALVNVLRIHQIHAARELTVDLLVSMLAFGALLLQQVERVAEKVLLRDRSLTLNDEGVCAHFPRFFRLDVLAACVHLLGLLPLRWLRNTSRTRKQIRTKDLGVLSLVVLLLNEALVLQETVRAHLSDLHGLLEVIRTHLVDEHVVEDALALLLVQELRFTRLLDGSDRHRAQVLRDVGDT